MGAAFVTQPSDPHLFSVTFELSNSGAAAQWWMFASAD